MFNAPPTPQNQLYVRLLSERAFTFDSGDFLFCLFSTASIAENGGEMPFLSHTTALPGHLAVAVDARSPGRSVSEAFFQAVGVHNPHDRPARQHLDMDLVKNRGKCA